MVKQVDDDWKPAGGRRAALIPSHNSSFTGRLGQDVLQRYANRSKAIYKGSHLTNPTKTQLRDISNWQVKAKSGDSKHQWTSLTKSFKSKNSGRKIRSLHLGHKLAAAEYYDKGAKGFIARRVRNTVAAKRKAKETKLKARYSGMMSPGKNVQFAQREGINNSENVRFEIHSYNTSHGGDGHNYGQG